MKSFGSPIASVLAGIQHEVVDVRHWLSAREFIEAFVIARAARPAVERHMSATGG